MARKRSSSWKPKGNQNPNQIQQEIGNRWYVYYYNQLLNLAYQLVEWENLPPQIDPRFLEMVLMNDGHCGIYKDRKVGLLASKGTYNGKLDYYYNPTRYQCISPQYNKSFEVFSYIDENPTTKKGVIIWNNDTRTPVIPTIQLFATELTEIQEIIRVNMNAQKTPVLISAPEEQKLSILNLYNQYEGNAPVIVGTELLKDMADSIQVFKTDAPYVVDKLQARFDAVWNNVMTFFGIANVDIRKKERLVSGEADGNNEQVQASQHVYLKTREEALRRLKILYPKEFENTNVKMRTEAIEQLQQIVSRETMKGSEENG